MNILGLIPFAEKLIDKLIPDPQKAAEAKIKVLELEQAGQLEEAKMELSRDLAQIDLNKIDAASDDKYKSRWRPTIGWICVFGLGYATVLQPFLTWFSYMVGIAAPPSVDSNVLMTVLGGILGIGMRSWEKRNVK